MYGPVQTDWRGRVTDDQTFYGEHVADGDYGGDKGTMVLKHVRSDKPPTG